MNFDFLIEIIQQLRLRLKLVFLAPIFILSSCIGSKFLKKGETILYKQEIKTDKGVYEEALMSLFEQTPNSRTPFIPISPFVYIYEYGHDHFDSLGLIQKKIDSQKKYDLKIELEEGQKKRNKLASKKLKKTEKFTKKIENGNLFMKWGEKLSVYNRSKSEMTRNKLKDYLFSQGYFDAKIDLKVKNKGVKSNVIYKIHEGIPYVIDSLILNIQDPKIKALLSNEEWEPKLKTKVYTQDLISLERDRVYDLLSNRGYFSFKKQYITFDIDSLSLQDNRLIVRENILNPALSNGHKVFKIDSVIFVAGGDGPRRQTKKQNEYYQNVMYDFTYNKYPKRILDWRIFMYPDSLYSKSNTLETQKQLSYLDVFKFVNINFDTTGGQFIVNIFTSPLKKYQTSSELGLSVDDSPSSNQKYPGPFINFSAKNRNVFQSMEIMDFSSNFSIQGTPSVSNQSRKYSRLLFGTQLSITLPQFLFPISGSIRGKLGKYNPRTKVAFGVNYEDRLGEYKRTTFNTSYAYLFQIKQSSQITYKPLEISYIRSRDFSENFAAILEQLEQRGNISYVSAFRSAFISSTSISSDYNSNSYGLGNTNSFLIRGGMEYGGFGHKLYGKAPFEGISTYYKYLKSNLDYRVNFRLSSNSAIACRANLGIAYVFGDSKSLPYEKYFFAGGSNSVRAWSPRRLGPGSYAVYDSLSNTTSYKREQPGDILFESSIEYRSSLTGIIDYALFVDAGNVWIWKSKTIDPENDLQKDNGRFTKQQAINELAVGIGVGLRIDLSFLVLRFDGALKVMDPGMPAGNRYVLDEVKLSNVFNRTQLNIGIGYPF